MTEREIKRSLEDRGIRVIDVARHMAADHDLKVRSAESMLRRLIAGQAWYPFYAEWLKKNYRVTVQKPAWIKSVRDRMKVAA